MGTAIGVDGQPLRVLFSHEEIELDRGVNSDANVVFLTGFDLLQQEIRPGQLGMN
mgnify:CR=1 FL=1